MTSTQQFALPDVGEGLTDAEIISWHVQTGDVVAINDTLVEIETAKSAVELPSPYAGVVKRLLADEGDTVDVGTPIIEIASEEPALAPNAVPPDGTTPNTPPAPAALSATAPHSEDEDKPQVLVGPGPTKAAARRRKLTPSTAAPESPLPSVGTESDTDTDSGRPAQNHTHQSTTTAGRGENGARTTPPVRLMAKRLGVDIDSVDKPAGSLVTRTDIETIAAQKNTVTAPKPQRAPTHYARETRTSIRGVRKITAEAMVRSAFTAPHVTEWLTVDVTPTMQLVARAKTDRSWDGVRINPLTLVARAFLHAIRAFPEINATWDDTSQEIVVKHYVNLGIAAATPRGLIVPNIKNAHELDTRGVANALSDLVTVARSGKTPPSDMAHGTITITNIGALGVDAGTPIINPGESAILAFGAIRQQPWVVDGRIEIRSVTQLAMSFDHRLVDGELGSNVLARTGAILADPAVALLHS